MKYPKGIIKSGDDKDTVEISPEQLLPEKEVQRILNELEVRTSGNFECHAIYLLANYDFLIVKDDTGCPVLVPIRKK